MSEAVPQDLSELITLVSNAARLGDTTRTALAVKDALEQLIERGAIHLPAQCRVGCTEKYARRLLYKDPDQGFAIVAMTWGPGQSTPLHDHAGVWCVEGVIDGEIEVTSYDLKEERAGRCRFAETSRIEAGIGGSGALIPPYEYHRIANRLPAANSITLHIYGDEMKECSVFRPEAEGWYRRETQALSYN